MPLYNPTIFIVPDGSIIQHPTSGEETTISNRSSIQIGTKIYCTNSIFQLMITGVNEDHPNFMQNSEDHA